MIGHQDGDGDRAAGGARSIEHSIAVDGEPEEDLQALRRVTFVMAGGAVVKATPIPSPSSRPR